MLGYMLFLSHYLEMSGMASSIVALNFILELSFV